MDQADIILEATQRIYDAAASPDAWTAAMAAITNATRGRRSLLAVVNQTYRQAELVVGAETDPDHLAAFAGAIETGFLPPWAARLSTGKATRSSIGRRVQRRGCCGICSG